MKTARAEFHIHTVLSPCADVEMIPPVIVRCALEKGIEVIAISDHNQTANIRAVQAAARGTGLTVLPGMELQTREEVHILCLFDTFDQAEAFQKIVDATLPDLKNDPDHFGEQYVVDATGAFIRSEDRMLSASSSMSLGEAHQAVTNLGGLFIPAHVNRRIYGMIATLGFIPQEPRFEALEISRHITPEKAIVTFPDLKHYPLLQSGDAHRREELLGANELTLEAINLAEIRLALQGSDERKLRILAGSS